MNSDYKIYWIQESDHYLAISVKHPEIGCEGTSANDAIFNASSMVDYYEQGRE